ncbi:class I SAM-dependent methyltransferase [Campylobacterota bacterium DY0563]
MNIFNNKAAFLEDFQLKYNEYNSICEYISSQIKKDEEFYIFGFCKVCDSPSSFLLDWKWTGNDSINFRERMQCKKCNLNNRQRFIMYYSKYLIKKHVIKDIYLYEQVTPFYKSLKNSLGTEINIVGSEYLGFHYKPGEVINEIRHEDALRLSFENESFDLIVSQDVLEHVPDFDKAICETSRVLRKGGQMLFTIPFNINREKSKTRAYINKNNKIIHLEEEMYHGNPVNRKGSLVFTDFGWDIWDTFKKYNFKLEIITYNDYFYGHIANTSQFCFLVTKLGN